MDKQNARRRRLLSVSVCFGSMNGSIDHETSLIYGRCLGSLNIYGSHSKGVASRGLIELQKGRKRGKLVNKKDCQRNISEAKGVI